MENECWLILKEAGLLKDESQEDLEGVEEELGLLSQKEKKLMQRLTFSIFMMKAEGIKLFTQDQGQDLISGMREIRTIISRTGEMIGNLRIDAMRTLSLGNYF